MLNKLSLRNRLTLITILVLVLLAVGISVFALYNAENAMFVQFRDFQHRHLPLDQPNMGVNPIPPPDAQEFQDLMVQTRTNFVMGLMVTMLFFITLGSAIMYYFAGKALKPVTDLSHKIADINAHNLDEKLEITNANDEISSLTHSFNQMLEKLAQNFDTQKRFSQNAAHELKTPLTCIMANIEVLELDEYPTIEEYQEVVSITKRSTLQLMQLVESLLQINMLGAQTKQKIMLQSLIENILKDLEFLILEKNITVTIDGDVSIYGDIILLERLFSNIISNAIRYNKQGGTITITILDNAIEIMDSGIGIKAEQLTKIFEPFYCIDDSRSKKLGGSGLGLSIVKDVLREYNLEYTLSSQENQYTKFTIYLTNIINA